MSAIPKPIHQVQTLAASSSNANATFLSFLPAVRTHASIQLRHLPAADRDECVAEAVASAFVNCAAAHQRGTAHRLTPSTVANFAVLGVKAGRHVGGCRDSAHDVLSRRAQRAGGFRVMSLPRLVDYSFDCLRTPEESVWRDHLLDDSQTAVPDQVCFRCDWSAFLAGQTDRTRRAIALLAQGFKRTEVADKLGVTAPAVTQRMARAQREWRNLQDDSDGNGMERSVAVAGAHGRAVGSTGRPLGEPAGQVSV